MNRNILKEADDTIHGAEKVAAYGKATETYIKVALIVTELLDKDELRSLGSGIIPPTVCLKIQHCVKLVRDSVSPTNPDHLRDGCGYLGILDDIRQEVSDGKD